MTEYFRVIDNISEMKYVFNKLKTPELGAVKTQMKSVLSSNADDVYKGMRETLKDNLDVEEFSDFIGLIDNPNSPLYDFISIN